MMQGYTKTTEETCKGKVEIKVDYSLPKGYSRDISPKIVIYFRDKGFTCISYVLLYWLLHEIYILIFANKAGFFRAYFKINEGSIQWLVTPHNACTHCYFTG
jgi:hypothetical protein